MRGMERGLPPLGRRSARAGRGVPRRHRLRRRRGRRRGRREAARRDHRRADHLDRRERRRRPGDDRRPRPGGHQQPHLRAAAQRRRGAVRGRRGVRQRAAARGADQGAGRGEHARTAPSSSRSAPRCCPKSDYIYDFSFPKEDGKPNPHLWTDPTYAIKYAEVDQGHAGRGRPGQRRPYYAANYDRLRAAGHRAVRRAARRPGDHPGRQARAADLPRRLRLLREDLRLERHRRDPAAELRGPARRARSPA